MGAARPASRTPGTVPGGLTHPNPHGRHTEAHMEPKHGGSIPSAGREEAEREYREYLAFLEHIDSPQALEEYLLFITNQEDDPNLSAIDNKRRRHTRILWAMRAYFDKLGFRDKVPELRKYIADLAIALENLIGGGRTDPLFVKTKGSKRDPCALGVPGSKRPSAWNA